MRNFFIAFLDELGNFKHFEPYLFCHTFYFRTFNFYTLQSAIVKQRYHTHTYINLTVFVVKSIFLLLNESKLFFLQFAACTTSPIEFITCSFGWVIINFWSIFGRNFCHWIWNVRIISWRFGLQMVGFYFGNCSGTRWCYGKRSKKNV